MTAREYARYVYEQMLVRGLTQRRLADAVGLSRDEISSIVRGFAPPSDDAKAKLEAFFQG